RAEDPGGQQLLRYRFRGGRGWAPGGSHVGDRQPDERGLRVGGAGAQLYLRLGRNNRVDLSGAAPGLERGYSMIVIKIGGNAGVGTYGVLRDVGKHPTSGQ